MLVVIGFGVMWPIMLATVHGFVAIEPRLQEVASALEMNPFTYFRKIALPSAMPDILAGGPTFSSSIARNLEFTPKSASVGATRNRPTPTLCKPKRRSRKRTSSVMNPARWPTSSRPP